MEVNNLYIPICTPYPPLKIETNPNKLQELVDKSFACMNFSVEMQNSRVNYSASMMFLDKVSRLVGHLHPDALCSKQFIGSPNTYASLEIKRCIEQVLAYNDLSQEIIKPLQDWITTENASLYFHVILDRWRLTYSEHGLSIEEVQIFSFSMAKTIQFMQPQERFNIPIGSLLHATRLHLLKNYDGTFDIIHFNTGDGQLILNGNRHTACKYPSIPAYKLEKPEFWQELTKVQFQRSMLPMLEFLQNLGSSSTDIDEWLKKPLQENGSCVYLAILAEFKHRFISGFQELDKGWAAYKLFKGLMVSASLRTDSSALLSSQIRLMEKRNIIRHRYLDWINCKHLNSIKDAYVDALNYLGKDANSLIENLSPLKSLSRLDKELNQSLNFVSYDLLIQIRSTYGHMTSFNEVNHLGNKQMIWLESSKEWLLKTSAQILHQPFFNDFLTEYTLRESSENVNEIFTKLNIKKENFPYSYSILAIHLANCPGNITHILDLVNTQDLFKEIILMNACLLIINNSSNINHLRIEELTNLVSVKFKINFIVNYLIMNLIHQTKQATNVLNLIKSEQEKNLALDSCSYHFFCTQNPEGLKIISSLMSEGLEKSRTFYSICKLECDKGFILSAANYANKITTTDEKCAAYIYMFISQVKANNIAEAKIIFNAIPENPNKRQALDDMLHELIAHSNMDAANNLSSLL